MSTFLQRFKSHVPVRSVVGFCIGTVILFTLATPLIYSLEFTYEKWSPRTVWFHYSEVIPVKSEFKQGETLRFNSIASFYKHQNIQWFDTLYCSDGELTTKYQTQVFPRDRSEPTPPNESTIDDEKTWQYTEEAVGSHEIECNVCGTVVSETPIFNQKKTQDWGCTEWFGVNR